MQKLLEFNDTMQKLFLLIEVNDGALFVICCLFPITCSS